MHCASLSEKKHVSVPNINSKNVMGLDILLGRLITVPLLNRKKYGFLFFFFFYCFSLEKYGTNKPLNRKKKLQFRVWFSVLQYKMTLHQTSCESCFVIVFFFFFFFCLFIFRDATGYYLDDWRNIHVECI